jgi:hypothetical protein
MYVDIIIGKCVSLDGCLYCALYATDFMWSHAHPMKEKKHAHYTLDGVVKNIGIPTGVTPDNAKELTGGLFGKKAKRYGIEIHPIEAYRSNQNYSEGETRELKRFYRRVMCATNTPECLWDRCFRWCSLIRSHSAIDHPKLHGETPATKLLSCTVDISFLAELGWYEWCWYIGNVQSDSLEVKWLGRYVGPSILVGEPMCGAILNSNGHIVNTTSYYPLSLEDTNSEVITQKKLEYTTKLTAKLLTQGKDVATHPAEGSDETPHPEPYMPADPAEPEPEPIPEADEMDQDTFNKYISARVLVPKVGEMAYGTVKRRKRNSRGDPNGHSNPNPFHDTSVYEIDFDSGDSAEYTANIIAENIYAQVDDEGWTCHSVAEIVDHRFTPDAVRGDEAFVFNVKGKRVLKRTTKGVQHCVKWKDGSTTWVSLKDVKESNPIEVAEYAYAHNLQNEPAYAWWVRHTLRRRDHILKAMKKRYFRR